jgi:hypothetical protein
VKNRRSGLYEMSELCDPDGISRKTGSKWLHRFEAEGAEGLVDRSRAPRRCEHRMADAVREALLEVRRRQPTWGPRKLLAWLAARKPKVGWPAASSVGEFLRREGLVAFSFPHQLTHLSSALAGEWLGLDEIDDGIWSVYLWVQTGHMGNSAG